MDKNTTKFLEQISDESVSIIEHSNRLIDVLVGIRDGKTSCLPVGQEVFRRLRQAPQNLSEKEQELRDFIRQLQYSPLRPATFVRDCRPQDGTVTPRAMVMLDNGDTAVVVAPNQDRLKELKTGDRVLVDPNLQMIVDDGIQNLHSGEVVRFERQVDEQHLEVITRQDDRALVIAGEEVSRLIKSGSVNPGDSLILSGGNCVAVWAIPKPKDDLEHCRFLDRGPIPDVLVDRDIGNPPPVIAEVLQHCREEMLRPELRRRYRLRPCITRLLCGVSGTGKSLAIAAIHRALYDLMSEITGAQVEDLPPRVFRCKPSQMFSMWFGESDKNFDRFFDEVEKWSERKFTHRKKEHRLPVMVVIEEADGFGHARGAEGNSVYDRVMTTMLQRLDPNRESLASRFVVFLSTTNTPHVVDPAFLRRIGGRVERFGRLDERGFSAVLKKHLRGLPFQDGHQEIQKGLFEEDPGIVDVIVGGQPIRKYQRDFLTGALVDRAVQQASSKAWEMAIGEKNEVPITAKQVLHCIREQVNTVLAQLTEHNIHNYLDLPEGARVSGMRRVVSKQ